MTAIEAWLSLKSSGHRFSLTNGQCWAIGRGHGSAVLLESSSISRLHALVQRRDVGDFSLVDLGSRNGSFVNGQRVSVPVVLHDGDKLVFGDQELVFHNSSLNAPLSEPATIGAHSGPTAVLQTDSLTTIMVVDIRDFTPLARTVPESLLSQTIGTWFRHVGRIAQQRNSWGQRYIGDAVMAVWIHDDPSDLRPTLALALRAISEIGAVTSEMHGILPLPWPLRVGAGLNTGLAMVGGSDMTALGDAVNAAFRLEAATKQIGLDVALGERTFKELRVAEVEPFSQHQVTLKGYEGKPTAWGISFEKLAEFLSSS